MAKRESHLGSASLAGSQGADRPPDCYQIRQLIENWVLWRDSGDWDRLGSIWHPEGRMATTWFQASANDFIARSRLAWNAGMKVYHTLGGSSIDVRSSRAIAQTRMHITQRASVDGVMVDVDCLGRFWDAFERRGERWGLLLRQPIYELDRISSVDPQAGLALDPELLARFPEGYRHLAYVQTLLGFEINPNLPGTRGPEVEALQERGQRWLSGESTTCLGV